MPHPNRYGVGLGPYRPIQPIPFKVGLRNGGLNLSENADDIEEGQTPNAIDVRMDKGGVSTDYPFKNHGSASGSVGDKDILHVAPYQKENLTKFIMRLRDDGWDRWNGTNWTALSGSLTGTPANRYYSTVMDDLFLAANGVDRIKKWDGVDANAVADLSAEAPKAAYITRIGNRLMAARIDTGVLEVNLIQWSADGDITEWTDPLLGAGSTTLAPEGRNKPATPNYITGLSTLARGAAIYRQNSLVLATLTGIGAAPFRFQTVDFDHGTESPQSISSGGPRGGDYFLGADYMVYNFTGVDEPAAIGDPIINALTDSISDPRYVVGAVDHRRMEYWLGITTDETNNLREAYIFSIREWKRTGRLVWRKKSLPAKTLTFGFGQGTTLEDPFVDDVDELVDSVDKFVDDYAIAQGRQLMMLGDEDGQVKVIDEDVAIATGQWDSRDLGDAEIERTLEMLWITFKATSATQVEISVSTDGGTTFTNPQVVAMSGTGRAPIDVGITGSLFRIRLRILSGFVVINKLSGFFNDRGRAGI